MTEIRVIRPEDRKKAVADQVAQAQAEGWDATPTLDGLGVRVVLRKRQGESKR